MKIRRAVITAAGWGTRFLPVTKAQPKEMLPLVNKPLIQYAVEEAINSGIEQIIIVTAMGKRSIEDYFDRSYDLEHFLEQKGQTSLLKEIRKISFLPDISYIRQKEQLGLGNAVLTAKNFASNEPLALILPDDIIYSRVPALKQMMAVYERYNTSVIAVQRVHREDTEKYGIIESKEISARIHQIQNLVEKPEPAQAPSNLGVVGRYILTPEIFNTIEATPPGKNQEVQLTDALQLLLREQAIYAYEFEGTRYDTGTPLGWLKATLDFALQHPDIKEELKEYMRQML
ncbi:UTP--glucose-1-phosphate uridylyltransferase GalU [Chloroflexota bacterium]